MTAIPRIEFTIDEEDSNQGIKMVSLVDEPAIESNFVYFNKEKNEIKPKFVKLEKEGYKQVVFGAVLIPDKDILRVDENENYYNGYFTAETIEKLRNKFHQELQTNNVNEDHDPNQLVDAFLIESYIIDSEERLKDAEEKGLQDITMGTWIAAYKIKDEDAFNRVLEGELNGFSIEAFLQKEFSKVFNNNSENKLSKMKNKLVERLQKIIDDFKVENFEDVNEELNEQNDENETSENLARNTTVDGDMYEWGEVGEPVMKVITNEETQEETTEPVEEGTYTFEDGSSIVVDADGNLVEFNPAPESEESEEEEVEMEEDENMSDSEKKLSELVDLEKDGYYTIEVMVEKGKVSYGAVYSSSYKELELKAEEKFKAEKEELKKKIEQLENTVISEAAQEEAAAQEEEEEVDFNKLTNIEKIAMRNKIKLK